jgi:hypothetical protein
LGWHNLPFLSPASKPKDELGSSGGEERKSQPDNGSIVRFHVTGLEIRKEGVEFLSRRNTHDGKEDNEFLRLNL